MKAVLPAGGFGSRISEESVFKPKPMIEIVGMPIPTIVNPIIQYGVIPVFVDICPPGFDIDVTKLEEAYVEGRTKAVDIIGWTPEVSKEVRLDGMLNWLQK